METGGVSSRVIVQQSSIVKKRGILRLKRTSVYAPDEMCFLSGARRAYFERTFHETPPRWRESEWVEIFIKITACPEMI